MKLLLSLESIVHRGTSYNTLLEERLGSAGLIWRHSYFLAGPEMALSLDDVKRIARLARLEINDSEAYEVLAQLQAIFRLIEELQSVDTRGIEPMSHAQSVSLRLREDRVTESDMRERFQNIAPQVDGGLYLVPKVVE